MIWTRGQRADYDVGYRTHETLVAGSVSLEGPCLKGGRPQSPDWGDMVNV